MFTSSQDLFFIVLSFSVLWLTIFIAWLVYYLAMICRQMYLVLKEWRHKIDIIDEFFATLREKIEHSSSHLALLVEITRDLLSYFKERNKKKIKIVKE